MANTLSHDSDNSVNSEAPLCECGCGQRTTMITQSAGINGRVKGQYNRFVRFHYVRLYNPSHCVPLEKRFWSKVDKTGDCWEWQGKRDRNGYGKVQVNRRDWLAHRLAYTLACGDIPNGLVIRHRCDNPPCCNPSHLIAGTQSENVADAWERNLVPSRVKLTPQDVREIRATYRKKYGAIKAMAKRYNVCSDTIKNVISGKKWKRIK